MKTKKIKLSLNKKTISNLLKVEMNEVRGGHDSSPTCPAYTLWQTCRGCNTLALTICVDCNPPFTS